MLSKAMLKALNDQINEELFSSYLYQSMSAWFSSQNLNGFAHWFQLQAKEEWGHGMKIYNYIHLQRGQIILEAIKQPQSVWKSPLDVFEAGFKHEQHITACFTELVSKAQKDKDNATLNFLQWYVSEQVEEEATFDSILHTLRLIGDHMGSMFMMDKTLGKRA